MMTVKILIKRKVSEKNYPKIRPLLMRLRNTAMDQKGYVSGVTLERVDMPDHFLVISTWQSLDDWEIWFKSDERREIQNMIDAILGEQTQFEVYKYA